MTSIRKSHARDVYWQRFLKYPPLTVFHSRIELLHAALLEGDPSVSAFVPHPFRLRAAAREIPGCYLQRRGERVVQVIDTHNTLSDSLGESLREFFVSQQMGFEVITGQKIQAREIEARNWLTIVRHLVDAEILDTTARESVLLRKMQIRRESTLGELLGRRIDARDEIALFRLLHRGILHARLDRETLSPRTRLILSHDK